MRRGSILDNVEHHGSSHFGGDGRDLVDRLRSLDEDQIRSRIEVGIGATYRLSEPERTASVRSGDENEVSIFPGVDRGPDLLDELLTRNDGLAAQVATTFWVRLVFDVESSDARTLIFDDRSVHVEGVPESGVGIGHERAGQDAGQAGCLGSHLAHREQPEVGDASERHRDGRPRHVGPGKPAAFHQRCGQRVVDAGQDGKPRFGQDAPECRSW